MNNKQYKTIGKVDVIAQDFIGITYSTSNSDVYTLEVEKLEKYSYFKVGDNIEIIINLDEMASQPATVNYVSEDYSSIEYRIANNNILTLELDNEFFAIQKNCILETINYDLSLKAA